MPKIDFYESQELPSGRIAGKQKPVDILSAPGKAMQEIGSELGNLSKTVTDIRKQHAELAEKRQQFKDRTAENEANNAVTKKVTEFSIELEGRTDYKNWEADWENAKNDLKGTLQLDEMSPDKRAEYDKSFEWQMSMAGLTVKQKAQRMEMDHGRAVAGERYAEIARTPMTLEDKDAMIDQEVNKDMLEGHLWTPAQAVDLKKELKYANRFESALQTAQDDPFMPEHEFRQLWRKELDRDDFDRIIATKDAAAAEQRVQVVDEAVGNATALMNDDNYDIDRLETEIDRMEQVGASRTKIETLRGTFQAKAELYAKQVDKEVSDIEKQEVAFMQESGKLELAATRALLYRGRVTWDEAETLAWQTMEDYKEYFSPTEFEKVNSLVKEIRSGRKSRVNDLVKIGHDLVEQMHPGFFGELADWETHKKKTKKSKKRSEQLQKGESPWFWFNKTPEETRSDELDAWWERNKLKIATLERIEATAAASPDISDTEFRQIALDIISPVARNNAFGTALQP